MLVPEVKDLKVTSFWGFSHNLSRSAVCRADLSQLCKFPSQICGVGDGVGLGEGAGVGTRVGAGDGTEVGVTLGAGVGAHVPVYSH